MSEKYRIFKQKEQGKTILKRIVIIIDIDKCKSFMPDNIFLPWFIIRQIGQWSLSSQWWVCSRQMKRCENSTVNKIIIEINRAINLFDFKFSLIIKLL